MGLTPPVRSLSQARALSRLDSRHPKFSLLLHDLSALAFTSPQGLFPLDWVIKSHYDMVQPVDRGRLSVSYMGRVCSFQYPHKQKPQVVSQFGTKYK